MSDLMLLVFATVVLYAQSILGFGAQLQRVKRIMLYKTVFMCYSLHEKLLDARYFLNISNMHEMHR